MRTKWAEAIPHLTIGVLGVVAEVMLHDEHLKIIALMVAIFGIAAWHFSKLIWPVLRRNIRDAKNAPIRAELVHRLNHHTRDEMVKQMPPVPLTSSGNTSAARCLPSLLSADSVNVRALLETGVQIVRTHVDFGTNVWGSIRELRADGKYHTVYRAGQGFNPAREKESVPLDELTLTVQQLRNSYNRARCVIITGCNRGEELWTAQPSDRFGDDKCVLMGAVVVNSSTDKSPKDRLMVWIISICSDNENAFCSSHIPVMQGVVDSFSILANVVARQSWLKQPPTLPIEKVP